MRLAFGRLAQETNALSPLPSELEDFERFHLFEGEALLARCGRRGQELDGLLRNAELSGFVQALARHPEVTPVPLLSAWAVPSGPLRAEVFEQLVERMAKALEAAGPVEGLYLSLHGALRVQGEQEAEATLLQRLRPLLPDGAPIVVSLDLHALITRPLAESADALVAYRTNPHRDHAATGGRAAELLVHAAAGRTRPTLAWRSLPMYLGGGNTLDFLPPMRGVFKAARAIEKRPGVLSASLLMAHSFNDHPRLGWATVVVTDGDRELAEACAEELAERAWAVREAREPRFLGAEEAIARVRSARLRRFTGAALLCDASDVVGAGAPGENTRLVSALLEHGRGLRALVPLRSPKAVERLYGLDGEVELSLGGELDPETSPPIRVRGRVGTRRFQAGGPGRCVVLDTGDLALVLTEGPPLAMRPSFFTDMGLSPLRADIVVVKNFFPFLVTYLPYNRQTFYVRTRGVTDLDAVAALDFEHPLHPRDPVSDWRPTDRARRHGT